MVKLIGGCAAGLSGAWPTAWNATPRLDAVAIRVDGKPWPEGLDDGGGGWRGRRKAQRGDARRQRNGNQPGDLPTVRLHAPNSQADVNMAALVLRRCSRANYCNASDAQ